MLKSNFLLKAAFHFNDADLYDNRNGRISDRQKIRLQYMQFFSLVHILIIFFIGFHIIAIIHCMIATISLFQAEDMLGAVRLLVGALVLILTVICLSQSFIKRLKKLSTDIQNKWVETRTGHVTFRCYRRKIIFYLMQIEGESYIITCWQMWAFHKHRKHHIYIAPQMKLVLSAEPI